MELVSSVMHIGAGDQVYRPRRLKRFKKADRRFESDLAGTNRIDRFQRVPSELRKYLEYMGRIKAEYGSVMRFVVTERLCWGDGSAEDLRPRGGLFEFSGKERTCF